LKKRIDDVDSAINKSRDGIASLNTEIRLLVDGVNRLQGLGAKCPTCESDVSEERKSSLIEEKKKKEAVLREKVAALASEAEKQGKEKEKLEAELEKSRLEKAKLETVSHEADALKELETRMDDYTRRKSELKIRIAGLEAVLAKKDTKAIREALSRIVAKESESATKLSGFEERITDRQNVLAGLKERIETLERYRAEIKQDAEISEKLGSFVRVLRITQEQLRKEFLKTVNGIMGEIWKELYPYGDFGCVRLSIFNGDYILQLKETAGEGSWVSADGIVSGGERSMACLALRIAFSIAFIPNLKWLILDEPTHNLDKNAINQFSEILRERIGRFVDQVFLITHEERISESISGAGSLYRLERDKEANEPTRVTGV